MILAALPFPNIDPVAFSLGPVAVHWYGLAYVAGILFGWWYAKRLLSNERLWAVGVPPMRPAEIDDLLVFMALGIVVGGRLGFILFYDLSAYLANPAEIFAVWRGGMSFHGGMLGSVVAMVWFARSRGISPWSTLDVVAAGTPFALGLVRLTNFINSELWGRITDVPWAVEFPNGGPFTRHPSQIYEALLEGLVLFVVLRFLTHSRLKLQTPRFVGAVFIAGYGLARIFVEFFREPDAQLGYLLGTGWLTMGMVLSLPMVLVGIWGMATARHTVFTPRPEPTPAS
ncbi:MAG: prolipoprotein diacylglyceryl transferase [Mesorhizobium amorphae]|nr:MAG: prolipoprotein diacylglyceryl transferase [Mesorhizobium amorphae]